MKVRRKTVLWSIIAVCVAVPTAIHLKARASDHADTPAIAATPGVDLTDVYCFPSPSNPSNVVLVMNVHPLIPSGQGPSTVFDPKVLYQIKIDNVGDFKEHLTLQARFFGTGANQQVQIAGPEVPTRTGIQTVWEKPDPVIGTINIPFTTSTGIKVFAGAREDPFFFDLEQFFKILPDRATPLTGTVVANPDQPQATSFRPVGQAQDFLKGYNVLSIVFEMPKSLIQGASTSKIGIWATTSK